jgi:hypothetical protein
MNGPESSESLLKLLEPSTPPERELPLVPADSSLPEELLALLALLFLSFLSLLELAPDEPWLLPELLASGPTGLSRSKPNCSKERLKEVALVGSVR